MVLKDGEVMEEGDCLQVLQNPRSDYTRALLEAADLDRAR
jgi:microcin C transport system ATP-binding protein